MYIFLAGVGIVGAVLSFYLSLWWEVIGIGALMVFLFHEIEDSNNVESLSLALGFLFILGASLVGIVVGNVLSYIIT